MSFDLFGDVSTADDGERSDFDFYETASWMVRSLLHFHPQIAGRSVLECCSGRDAITRVLRSEFGCVVFTNDIDARHPAETHHDARDPNYWRLIAPPVDYIVTNLPFNEAIHILPHAVGHAQRGVASVLLKSFDEPTEDREVWLAANPWTSTVRLPRHSFRGTGSPSMASDWFLWERAPDYVARRPVEIDRLAKARTGRCGW